MKDKEIMKGVYIDKRKSLVMPKHFIFVGYVNVC